MSTVNRATDFLFRVGLIVKGVDSLFEVIGGALFLAPMKLARYMAVLSQHEAFHHHEVLAGRIDKLADTITLHTHVGEAIYLLIHGLAKVILIIAIFKGKRWGYVGFVGVLAFFMLIELTRAFTAREIVTGVLGLFDAFVVALIWKEYKARYGAGSHAQ